MRLIAAIRATPRLPAIIGTVMVLIVGLVGSQLTTAGDGFSKQLLAQTIVLLAALVVGFAGDDAAMAVTQTTSGFASHRLVQIVLSALWWAVVPGVSLLLVTRINTLPGDADLAQFVAEGLALTASSWCVTLASRRRSGPSKLIGVAVVLIVSVVIGTRYPTASVFSPEFVERDRLPGLVLLLAATTTLAITLLWSGPTTGRRHGVSLKRLGPISWSAVRSTPAPARILWAAGTFGVAAAGLISDPGFASTVARVCLLSTAVALPMAVVEIELPPSPVRVQVVTVARCVLLTALTAAAAAVSFIPHARLAIEATGMGGLGLLFSPLQRQRPVRAVILMVLAVSIAWTAWPPLGLDTHPESPDWTIGQRTWVLTAALLWVLGAVRMMKAVPPNLHEALRNRQLLRYHRH